MKNLDDGIDDERLRKEFSPFGTITSAKVNHVIFFPQDFGKICTQICIYFPLIYVLECYFVNE